MRDDAAAAVRRGKAGPSSVAPGEPGRAALTPVPDASATADRWEDLRHWLRAWHFRLGVARVASSIVPTFVGGCAVRAPLYRWAGFAIAPEVAIVGQLELTSSLPGFYEKLIVGRGTTIGHHVAINIDATVTIGENVLISPHAMIFTGNHRIGPASMRSSKDLTGAPVTIEDGAWVRAAAVILPGVTIGRGSIVGAGAVVTKDVPENVYVEGNPATVVHRLPWGDR